MVVNYQNLKSTANSIRHGILKSVHAAGSGHPGGSLSAVEILTVLYFYKMNIDPQNPQKPDRDRFVLSKGHAAPVLYSTLAERGYFEKEKLVTLRKVGSMLQGHPDMKRVPGVDMSTGSLAQGFSAGIGMALAGKLDKSSRRIYTLLGDGELQEGLIWEAAMSGAHYKLNNLTAILDFNGLQIDGPNDKVMSIKPVNEKWKSFGWYVIEIDGHSFEDIIEALDEAETVNDRPTIIIAKTIKGKGVSYMENNPDWHGKAPDNELTEKAILELGGAEDVR